MPRPHLEPTTRTEVLLYTADREFLIDHFGTGWTAEVREAVQKMVQDLRRRPKTLGDLINND